VAFTRRNIEHATTWLRFRSECENLHCFILEGLIELISDLVSDSGPELIELVGEEGTG